MRQDDWGASALQWTVVAGQNAAVEQMLKATQKALSQGDAECRADVDNAYTLAKYGRHDAIKKTIGVHRKKSSKTT